MARQSQELSHSRDPLISSSQQLANQKNRKMSHDIFFPLDPSHLQRALQLGTSLACMLDNPVTHMKNQTILFLASLAVFATSANAAQSQLDTEVVVLPTYVVTVPRQQSFEQKIDASLNELRLQAAKPVAITSDFSTLRTLASRPSGASPDAKFLRVEKL
jgi:hypothetical protein